MKYLLCILILLGWAHASAQETRMQYQFLGFSEDLKFAAFETYAGENGMNDGSVSTIYFIDVDKNDYAAHSVKVNDADGSDEGLAKVRKATLKAADATLKSLKITGKKLGQTIPFHFEPNPMGDIADDEQPFIIANRHYKLRLKEVETGQVFADTYRESMAVVDLDYGGKKFTLQKATKAPKSWGFVCGYQFLSAYYIENKIAVFVEYHGPGFEGSPDRFQMIVTGILPR